MPLFSFRSKAASKQPQRPPQSSQQPSTSQSSSKPPPIRQAQPPQSSPIYQQDSISPLDTSQPFLNPSNDSPSKRFIGRKISHSAVDDSSKPKLPQPDPVSGEHKTTGGLAPPPWKTPSSNQSDMYTQNDLETFSFGAAPYMASSSSIFYPRNEVDSDEVILHPDTTPRPSVVESQHLHSRQLRPQPSGGDLRMPSSPARKKSSHRAKARDSDAASVNTFGINSSASASVSSISRPSGSNSRSRTASRASDTTHQTSANDLSSDDELSLDGRHPLRSPRRRYRYDDQDSSLYPSDDSSDGYIEDYDHDGESGIDIESLVYAGTESLRSLEQPPNLSQDNVQIDYSERKGSLAIPSAPSDTNFENRPRENSIATVRRPSRSMEDLYSFAFPAPSGSSTSRQFDNNPLPSPTSVPESLGDWKDLRKKSIQRDKDFLISPHATAGSSIRISKDDSASSMALLGSSAIAEFDTSWMHELGLNGVVGFDPSEVADVVGEKPVNGRRTSEYSGCRRSSAQSGSRRQSTISNGTDDIMHKRVFGLWASKKSKDQQRQWWTFVQEKDRLDDETTRHSTLPERERPSISSLFGSRPSTAYDSSLKPIAFFDRSDGRDKDRGTGKDRDKDKSSGKEPWRGMALETEEIWRNPAIGRFRVYRKNASPPEAGKPPQQRLNITFLRSPYFVNPVTFEPADGPAVTIHKHSKAGAFSISRHFRQKVGPTPQDTAISLRNTDPPVGKSSSNDSNCGKRSNMILLATRKVQKAYTTTNTTRKLESHGLLDDSGRTSPRDMERMRRERDRERQRPSKPDDKRKQKDRKAKDIAQERKQGESGKRVSAMARQEKGSRMPEPALRDSSEDSSSGSVVNNLTSGESCILANPGTPSTTPEASEGTSSFGSVLSIGPSLNSNETTSSDRTVSLRPHPRWQEITDDGDNEDDGFDERPRYPSRTPHRETYAALPPEVFESAHQENSSHGLFSWGKSRGVNPGGHRANPYLEASYNPPWPVTAPRYNSETKKGIVNDLNTSFQDVGLLPATGEIKGSSHNAQHKRRRDQRQTKQAKRITDRGPDIFETVPPDALYMILPLWPGETDTNSMIKYPFTPPPLPTSSRQYLLIWYKTLTPLPEDSKAKASEKKRSRGSPTSSHDSVNKADERGVLLSDFHIAGRVVTYRELQGSGVRIPDVGLAVSGPLEDAYQNMPSCDKANDYVLGLCNSREAGIKFLSEAFEDMGLARARNVPNSSPPESTAEDDDDQSVDTVSVLTPLGRAVMEMAWLGMLAVTSFNPHT